MADAKVVDSVTLEKLTRVYLKIRAKGNVCLLNLGKLTIS